MHRPSATGAGGGGGGRLHVAEEAAPDHDALLLLPEHAAVQEEDGSAGAAPRLHASSGRGARSGGRGSSDDLALTPRIRLWWSV